MTFSSPTESSSQTIVPAGWAVKDGRIDETQREKYVKLLHSSEAESARAILQSQKKKRLVKDILEDGTVVENGSWAKRQEEIRNKYNGKN